jgi:UDP-N-acetylmuramoylalanine--D-glutamate ligase
MSETVDRRALVVGLGASGVAAARLLVRDGWLVTITDLRGHAELAARLAELPEGVETALGGHPVSLLDATSLLVVSPGVAWELPLLAEARRRGVEVIAEIELAFRARPERPLVGVTGSNGKTTVTALIGEILRTAGVAVGVGGNIGTAACALALDPAVATWVLELSSFQLEGCSRLRPRVGLLLNLSPDHLDRHASMDAYRAVKARLFAAQRGEDLALLNADDPIVAAQDVPARLERFSLNDPGAEAHLRAGELILDGAPLVSRAELPLLGDHNVANALAAALAGARMGVPRDAIATALRRFKGLPHRHQLVGEVAGVRWVEDSKGTNIGATAAGLAGYPPGRVHLVLGGLGKGQDFSLLRPSIEGRVARLYVIGQAADEIAAALEGAAPIERCGTLDEAVRRGATLARPGDTVLLSPACASFDQFRDYADRGDAFARLVRSATGGGRA